MIMRPISLDNLVHLVNGQLAGTTFPDQLLEGTCPVDKYIAGKVAFVRNEKYAEFLSALRGALVLLPRELSFMADRFPQNTYVLVEDVVAAMMTLQEQFYNSPVEAEGGIAPTATLHPSAIYDEDVFIGENVWVSRGVRIGKGVKIFPNCCIFDQVRIGQNTVLYPGVTIYPRCRIGSDCTIHAGVCIGADGFRFEQDIEQKKVRKWLQAGMVTIGNRVEIGANSTIDRATFDDTATILADDVKLDDQVHIGHNAQVGARTLIAAQSCLSGSVKIGEDVWIGAGATISQNVVVGSRTRVLLNAVVAYDVGEDELVSGFYAMPHKQWKRAYEWLRNKL